jgi:hypothetical protein
VEEEPLALDDEPELCGVEEVVLVVGLDNVDVEIGTETVGEFAGVDAERSPFVEVVRVDPRRASISTSVAAHATGIPSFQTVTLGLGFTVTKL